MNLKGGYLNSTRQRKLNPKYVNAMLTEDFEMIELFTYEEASLDAEWRKPWKKRSKH